MLLENLNDLAGGVLDLSVRFDRIYAFVEKPDVGKIIVCGRMIAYNWFDCDKQPQPTIINTLTGCVVPPAGGAR